jgi:hypothetical protein
MKANCFSRIATLLILLTCFVQVHSQFSAAGTSAQTVATSGTAQNFVWTNPNNVQAADGNFATSLITGSNKLTYNLDATNWGFQTTNNTLPNYIPPAGTINGIEVYVKLRKTGIGSIKDNKIILLKAGAEAGSNKARNTLWPTLATDIKFGSNIDLWGTTWTASDLTNSGFGLRMVAKNRGSKDAQAEIDYIRIVLYFNQSYFYSKATGNLETLATWGRNTDGTGLAPIDFTTSGQVFFLQNRVSASLTGNLAISGAYSKMVVGDGLAATAFTIPAAYALNSTVDVSAASSLTITNTINPVLGSIADNTTVTYNAAGNQNVQDGVYYNLTLGGTGTKTLQSITGGPTAVNNVLTIGSGISFANSGNNVNVYGTANGISNNGSATGAGRFVYSTTDISTNITGTGSYSNLEVDFNTTSGPSNTLTLGGATSITGYLYLTNGNFGNGTNLTMASGSTIQIVDGVLGSSIATSSGYDVVYDVYTTASPKTTANEITGSIRNLTVQTGTGLAVNLNKNLALTGNLTISSGTLDATSSNYNISIGGNFSNNGTVTSRNNVITFNGSTAQTINGTAPAFYDLVINNPSGGVVLNSAASVSHGLSLTGGILSTSGTNSLTLANAVTISGGSANSYVDGPLIHTVSVTSGSRFFPIGKSGAYRPVTLTLTQKTTSSTTYTGEVFAGVPPSMTLPSTLASMSGVRYYDVSCSNNGNVNTATINLSYGLDDNVSNTALLRVAKSNSPTNSAWIDEGGTGSAVGTGTITSVGFGSFSYFALANSFTALPLRWISFTAAQKSNSVVLDWQTAEEAKGTHFTIEKTVNRLNWEEIAIVNCKNGSLNRYSYTDGVVAPQAFYRIKLVNLDGSSSYSNIVATQSSMQGGIRLLKNPVNRKGQLSCVIDDASLLSIKDWTVTIVDYHGRAMVSEKRKAESKINISTARLGAGSYVLIIEAGGVMRKKEFIVE